MQCFVHLFRLIYSKCTAWQSHNVSGSFLYSKFVVHCTTLGFAALPSWKTPFTHVHLPLAHTQYEQYILSSFLRVKPLTGTRYETIFTLSMMVALQVENECKNQAQALSLFAIIAWQIPFCPARLSCNLCHFILIELVQYLCIASYGTLVPFTWLYTSISYCQSSTFFFKIFTLLLILNPTALNVS